MKKLISTFLLLWSLLLVAQTAPAPPPTAPPPQVETGKFPDNSSRPPQPDKKITPEQAQELFRSIDEILKFVSDDTGLPIKHPVKRELASREQVEKYIQDRMQEDEDAKRLERSEIVLKKFGLLPRDFHLRTFLIELLKEQVAGFYDPKKKTVYLLDWVEPEAQKPVMAHELTHALQDQNFDMEKILKSARQDDPTGLEADERIAARQAVLEGQGMIVLLDYMLAPAGGSVAQMPKLVDAMQAGLTPAGSGMVVFNRAPLALQQVLLFPYSYGTTFVRDVLVAGNMHKAFAGALQEPPRDTRQVMDPATYLQHQFVPTMRPLKFDELAPGYKKWDLSAMGQFDVFLLLRQYASQEVAQSLSHKWRGGYYWAARVPSKSGSSTTAPTSADPVAPTTAGLALVYISRWTDSDTAAQFAAVYSDFVPKRYSGAQKLSKDAASPSGAPAAAVQVGITPRLTRPAIWSTSEGLVSIEPHGDTVLVMESFDEPTANRIRQAAFAGK
jgi:hypothetical protein